MLRSTADALEVSDTVPSASFSSSAGGAASCGNCQLLVKAVGEEGGALYSQRSYRCRRDVHDHDCGPPRSSDRVEPEAGGVGEGEGEGEGGGLEKSSDNDKPDALEPSSYAARVSPSSLSTTYCELVSDDYKRGQYNHGIFRRKRTSFERLVPWVPALAMTATLCVTFYLVWHTVCGNFDDCLLLMRSLEPWVLPSFFAAFVAVLSVLGTPVSE
eukprot:GHVU01145367.1.p1 GENE.GHVU01145367.1~~GHVU01145367.1.p1  ORF type:complete len:214 (+),score=21.19 GHVU01145367.1:480-1121(+)